MTPVPSSPDRPGGARRFLTFFGASAVGLGIDLGLFALLTAFGVEVWLANGVSATTSITAVYFLAARHSFAARPRISTYVAFFAWYSASIITFSFLIDFAATRTGWEPMIWKLASVPVSFLLNFAFSTILFRDRAASSQRREK